MGRSTQPDPIGLAGGLNLYGYAGGDPINRHDPFGLCDESKGEYRAPSGTCLSAAAAIGMVATASVNAIGQGFRMLRSAVNARRAAATRVAAANAGRGLTGRIVDALHSAGSELGARVDAVLDATKDLDAVHLRTLENGIVKISGGTGSRLREIYVRPDGSSVVRAFDAEKNAYRVVANIPAPGGNQ